MKPRAAPLSQFPVSGASKFLHACRPKAPPHECPTGKPNILRIQRSPLPLNALLDLQCKEGVNNAERRKGKECVADLRRGFVFEYLAVQSEQLDRMLRSQGCWQRVTYCDDGNRSELFNSLAFVVERYIHCDTAPIIPPKSKHIETVFALHLISHNFTEMSDTPDLSSPTALKLATAKQKKEVGDQAFKNGNVKDGM